MPKKCTKISKDPLIKVEENGRKAVFINSYAKKYRISKIDGCIVTAGPRTDFLVSEIGNSSILVELKGKDLKHACEQLFASAQHENVRPLLENKVGFLIICSRFPRFDTYVARAKTHAARVYKTGFHVKCDQRELEINKIVTIKGT